MAAPRLFDAHAHLQNYKSDKERRDALLKSAAAGVALTLCAGTGPDDWRKVARLAGEGVLPCFGLHPWFVRDAVPDWEKRLEKRLLALPSCVGEIGLDKAHDADLGLQEEAFGIQLKLAAALSRPVVIHCVRAWGIMLDMLRRTRPASFMLHAYGGSPEMIPEFEALGGYFSFGGEILHPRREKSRRSLAAVPAHRLLFETEAPLKVELAEVLAEAAAVRGGTPEEVGALSWRNARGFLGGFFPAETVHRGRNDA